MVRWRTALSRLWLVAGFTAGVVLVPLTLGSTGGGDEDASVSVQAGATSTVRQRSSTTSTVVLVTAAPTTTTTTTAPPTTTTTVPPSTTTTAPPPTTTTAPPPPTTTTALPPPPPPPPAPANREEGKASWYDHVPGICAHKTLPFGTVVTVTHAENGNSTTCTVGDRGPFIAGWVIDLNPQQFEQLAPLSTGVIPVVLTW